MTLPINVELVKGSAGGAIDVELLKGVYVKSLSVSGDELTLIAQDVDGNEVTTIVTVGATSSTTGIRLAIGWSTDQTAEASELTATSETDSVVIPDHTENDYLVLWTADSAGTLSAIYTGSSFANGLNTYGDPVALELNGVAGMVRVTLNRRTVAFVEGLTVRVEFTQ